MNEVAGKTSPQPMASPYDPVRVLLLAGKNDEAIVKLCALLITGDPPGLEHQRAAAIDVRTAGDREPRLPGLKRELAAGNRRRVLDGERGSAHGHRLAADYLGPFAAVDRDLAVRGVK